MPGGLQKPPRQASQKAETRDPAPHEVSPGASRAVSCARRALTLPSSGGDKPPRQLTALGEPPGRLTCRLFTAFHSSTLRSAPRLRAPPPRRRRPQTRRHCPQARGAMPPSDSVALHCMKTAETGDSPGQRITGPSSGNARKLAGLRCGPVMRWPPMFVWPLVGQANSSLLPSLLSLPVQKPEQRDPAPQDTMAFPRRRESGQLLLRLRCSFLRVWASAELAALTAAANVSLTSGRPCSAPGPRAQADRDG